MRWGSVVLVIGLLLVLGSTTWSQEPSQSPAGPSPTDRSAEATSEEPSEAEGEAPVAQVVALTELVKGDHVNLLVKTGQNFEGHVVAVGPTTIVLDFSFSLQRVTGVVTFPRDGIAVVMKLPKLSKEEREARLERRRQRALKAREQWTMVASTELKGKPQVLELTPEQKEERRRAEEERQVEQYRALLREFPPEQGWGPQRLAQIRHRHFILGMPVTYPEWRFWQIFDEWSEAQTIVELYEQRQKQEQQMLVTLFPPAEGWGPAVKQQLEEQQASGKELTKLEAQFLKDYQRWQAAVAARAAEQQKPTLLPTPSQPPATTP